MNSFVSLQLGTLLLLLGPIAVCSQEPNCSDYTYQRCWGDLGCFDDCYPFEEFPRPTTPSNINTRFYLHTNSDTDYEDHELINAVNPGNRFNGTRTRTFFLIHSRGEDRETGWLVDAVTELQRGPGDFNVIVVDWKNGAVVDPTRPLSPVPQGNTRVVAMESFFMAETLRIRKSLRLDDLHCVGHGLGAHVCGFLARRYRENGDKLKRITGLDPFNGIFVHELGLDKRTRLSEDDADFVDIIHTNAYAPRSVSGVDFNCGHVDFWPNKGQFQTGCISPLDDACSHRRSALLWAASVNLCIFVSDFCSTFEHMLRDECETCTGANCQSMGFKADQYTGRGSYFITTTGSYPFC